MFHLIRKLFLDSVIKSLQVSRILKEKEKVAGHSKIEWSNHIQKDNENNKIYNRNRCNNKNFNNN